MVSNRREALLALAKNNISRRLTKKTSHELRFFFDRISTLMRDHRYNKDNKAYIAQCDSIIDSLNKYLCRNNMFNSYHIEYIDEFMSSKYKQSAGLCRFIIRYSPHGHNITKFI